MVDVPKKEKKAKKKEQKQETVQKEEKEEVVETKEEKKEITEEAELSYNFEVEECRMHETEYPQSNDLVYVFLNL